MPRLRKSEKDVKHPSSFKYHKNTGIPTRSGKSD